MESEWMTYLRETRPDLFEAMQMDLTWMVQWRDEQIVQLMATLVGLVGSDDPKVLQEMETAIRLAPKRDAKAAAMINAIHALLREFTPTQHSTGLSASGECRF